MSKVKTTRQLNTSNSEADLIKKDLLTNIEFELIKLKDEETNIQESIGKLLFDIEKNQLYIGIGFKSIRAYLKSDRFKLNCSNLASKGYKTLTNYISVYRSIDALKRAGMQEREVTGFAQEVYKLITDHVLNEGLEVKKVLKEWETEAKARSTQYTLIGGTAWQKSPKPTANDLKTVLGLNAPKVPESKDNKLMARLEQVLQDIENEAKADNIHIATVKEAQQACIGWSKSYEEILTA